MARESAGEGSWLADAEDLLSSDLLGAVVFVLLVNMDLDLRSRRYDDGIDAISSSGV
jgi:hypothetical protein